MHDVKRGEKQRSPSPPFITSTLQQEASRRLGMTPRRTMSIAQQLYEGVDLAGRGTTGLITYMRTDSLRLSDEALRAAKDFIIGRYGPEYYPEKTRTFKTKSGAQDAHEAIRPTDVTLTPESVRHDLTQEQYRLYRLIWGRFTASQMANAVYDNVVVDARCAGHTFRANYSEQKFAGYTAVYEEAKDEETSEVRRPLPALKPGDTVLPEKLTKEQQFTQPPTRYTEATLIRAMEEKGIGRPSTYAPTISTITSRNYVIKGGQIPAPDEPRRGRHAAHGGLLQGHRRSEVHRPHGGRARPHRVRRRQWKDVLASFYGGFDSELTSAEKALEGQHIKVPDELSDEVCDVCGRQMVVKTGRFGRFLACPGFPECTFTKPLVIEMPGKCPRCGSRILKRTSRKGYTFYACERGQECGFMSWEVPTKEFCPDCGKTLFKPAGKGKKKPFCINEACKSFVPEDQRGYRRRKKTDETPADGAEPPEPEKKTAAKKSTAKKPAAKKTAAKKTTKAK